MNKEPGHKLELYEKLKTLSLEELRGYEKAAKSSQKFVGLIAVSSIFGSLVLSSTVVMIVAGIFVYMLANISIGMNRTLAVIREQIAKLEKA